MRSATMRTTRRCGGIAGVLAAALVIGWPAPAAAQRQLSWDRIDVEAHLDAGGRLRIIETQSMVFTGDWNGGERRFADRAGQTLRFVGVSRGSAGDWRPLRRDGSIDDVDEYAFTDPFTLRWRSRLPGDRPFNQTRIVYRLEYEWSGILQRDGDAITLDHDFLFADRDGEIAVFTLRLTLDPVWQPGSPLQDVYTAQRLAPGHGFVLTVPLRYTGAGTPFVVDMSRRPAIVQLAGGLLAAFALAVVWLFKRERDIGRFAPLHPRVDDSWLRTNILAHPAEVVGAAWDEEVGRAEVLALLARLERDGVIESEVSDGESMTLRLRVARHRLGGYVRELVDGLFFGDRVVTSTDDVQAYYRDTGFNPADVIRPGLESAVTNLLHGRAPARSRGAVPRLLYLAGAGVVALDALRNGLTPGAIALAVGCTVLFAFARPTGVLFRSRIHWNHRAAALSLTPAAIAVATTVSYLWLTASIAVYATPATLAAGLALMALSVVVANVLHMRSQRTPAAIAFRKKMAAARAYFAAQLQHPQPALRDDWMPWILAFGLHKQVERWTTHLMRDHSSPPGDMTYSTSFSDASRGNLFSGGRSGGAGAGASWVSALSSVSAGVPSPGGSGGGDSGGGGGGGGGGSSGGGGGGGW